MYLKLSSSLLPPGRLRSISESGWAGTGCASVPSTASAQVLYPPFHRQQEQTQHQDRDMEL